MPSRNTTINLEQAMKLGANHLEKMVDDRGRTYFDVFWTQPAEAVFDWPDFVDLPARYIEAATMIEPMLGRPVKTLPALKRWLYSHLEADGLFYRPDGLISKHEPELFDQARALYMLASVVMNDPNDAVSRKQLEATCRCLRDMATVIDDYAYVKEIGVYFGGTLIRGLVQAGLILNQPEWIDLGGALTRGILYHSNHYGPNGELKGHHHGHLSAMAGMLAYALIRNDEAVTQRVITLFNFSRSISTDFGFVPEVALRDDDLIVCETCTIMDYLDVALILARHVDPKYWDVVEKTTRNHLLESQVRDASWLPDTPAKADEEDIVRVGLREKLIGAFAGWSSPNGLLACAEELHPGWVRTDERRPHYIPKVRAFQNCCAGAGIRALYQVWTNLAIFHNDTLDVNVLIDKHLPQAKITSFIPFRGCVRVELMAAASIRIRIPSNVTLDEMRATSGGQSIALTADSAYAKTPKLPAGTVVEFTMPMPTRTEAVTIANPRFQSYRYTAQWKGDTVISMAADPTNPKTGYSGLMKQNIPVFYGPDAPGPMYQRASWMADHADVAISPSTTDKSTIDWYSLTPIK